MPRSIPMAPGANRRLELEMERMRQEREARRWASIQQALQTGVQGYGQYQAMQLQERRMKEQETLRAAQEERRKKLFNLQEQDIMRGRAKEAALEGGKYFADPARAEKILQEETELALERTRMEGDIIDAEPPPLSESGEPLSMEVQEEPFSAALTERLKSQGIESQAIRSAAERKQEAMSKYSADIAKMYPGVDPAFIKDMMVRVGSEEAERQAALKKEDDRYQEALALDKSRHQENIDWREKQLKVSSGLQSRSLKIQENAAIERAELEKAKTLEATLQHVIDRGEALRREVIAGRKKLQGDCKRKLDYLTKRALAINNMKGFGRTTAIEDLVFGDLANALHDPECNAAFGYGNTSSTEPQKPAPTPYDRTGSLAKTLGLPKPKQAGQVTGVSPDTPE